MGARGQCPGLGGLGLEGWTQARLLLQAGELPVPGVGESRCLRQPRGPPSSCPHGVPEHRAWAGPSRPATHLEPWPSALSRRLSWTCSTTRGPVAAARTPGHADPSQKHARGPWSGTKHGTGGWEHVHCQCVRFGCAWQPHRSPHIRGRPAPGRTSLPGHCSGPPAAAQVLGLRHPPGLRPPGLLLPFVLPPGPGVLVQCSPDAVPGLGHLAAAHPPQASPAGWPRGAGRSLLAAGAGRHVAHRRHGGSVHPRRTLVLPGPPEEGPRRRGWSAKPHA